MAQVVAREHGNIHRSPALNAAGIVRLLERCDALRKPERFADVLLACECDARGRLGLHDTHYCAANTLAQALRQAKSVATHLISDSAQSTGASGQMIGKMIHQERIQAVQAGIDKAAHAAL